MAGSNSEQFAVEIARIAEEHQADQIVVMDLRRISPVTDYFVICSGTSDRQRSNLCDVIREYARKVGERPKAVAGYESANWILMDFFDVVVHIFAPKYRDYYDLELLWGDAPRIEWSRSASA
jgi:ribosome-associated protein